jgi:alkanesulfonate monooxygenase SsuD/methylene tetrahydromethanopterin reductase-like flavin-dependent oxidoreductase (luciferase family)
VSLGPPAGEKRRIGLGTLMTAATFRLPGPPGVMVAQVDRMSGGRIAFGFDTGGYELEHSAYGIPFPGLGERFDRFEEQLAVVTGLWDTPEGETVSYSGRHYRLTDSPALPKPLRTPRPPVIIGGRGRRRTPHPTARYTDEYNFDFPAPAEIGPQRGRLRADCAEAGRDPATLSLSAVVLLVCGRDDAEVARRADAGGLDTSRMTRNGLVGPPARIVDRIGMFAAEGISRLYVRTPSAVRHRPPGVLQPADGASGPR